MSRALAAALVLALSAATALAAGGDKLYMDRSKQKKTEVSGVSGEIHKHEIPEEQRAVAMIGFKFYTLQGQTHGVYGMGHTLPGRDNAKETTATFGEWYQVDGSKMNTHEISRGPGYFVRGVRVCTQDNPNTGERSIRGMKIRYARVKPNGDLEPQDDPEVWVNSTGCDKWEELVKCGPGELAVGYRVHKAEMGFRAIGLICSPVAVRTGA